jgi:hypothetical protein
MGLMDRVKAQATQLAQKTQETARDSKAKFDQAQAHRRADGLLRNLGALVYAERTGRGGDDSQAQIDKLVAEISAHEAQNGINLTQQADQPGSAQGSPAFQDAGPTSTLNFGDAVPSAGFPDSGAATSFPDPAATSFPAPATSFPGAAPSSQPEPGDPTSFPGAAPSSQPEPGGATSFPEAGTPTSFPASGGATSFPNAAPATPFPDPTGSDPESGPAGS